jgi:ABC-type antimicrobial peptide transport system permease subunit
MMGGVLGLAIGWTLSKGIEEVAAGFGFQGMKWQTAAIVLGMAGLVGVLAASVPAVVASRKNVVESLRFTG